MNRLSHYLFRRVEIGNFVDGGNAKIPFTCWHVLICLLLALITAFIAFVNKGHIILAIFLLDEVLHSC